MGIDYGLKWSYLPPAQPNFTAGAASDFDVSRSAAGLPPGCACFARRQGRTAQAAARLAHALLRCPAAAPAAAAGLALGGSQPARTHFLAVTSACLLPPPLQMTVAGTTAAVVAYREAGEGRVQSGQDVQRTRRALASAADWHGSTTQVQNSRQSARTALVPSQHSFPHDARCWLQATGPRAAPSPPRCTPAPMAWSTLASRVSCPAWTVLGSPERARPWRTTRGAQQAVRSGWCKLPAPSASCPPPPPLLGVPKP